METSEGVKMETNNIFELSNIVDRNILKELVDEGYSKLYHHQYESLMKIFEGKNVLVSSPTASGKSLIAYLRILQNAINGEKSLYIVPLKSLAFEKYHDLKKFEKLGISVVISTGDLESSNSFLSKNDIIVCTSEKADSLIRHNPEWLKSVTTVVVDEIHTMNDVGRGMVLEILIMKLRRIKSDIQIVSLSATVGNSKMLSSWLKSELIETDWRPVELESSIFYEKTLYFKDGSSREIQGYGIDGLVRDSLYESGQVLIFVNSRRSSSSLAMTLRDSVFSSLSDKEKLKLEKEISVLSLSSSIPDTLVECLRNGIAYHHAGLSRDARRSVEDLFRRSVIKCIVSTSTLSAGVNLPAKRVIVYHTWRYNSDSGIVPLSINELMQSTGRAGRPKYDSSGEAILFARSKSEVKRLSKMYFNMVLDDVESRIESSYVFDSQVLSLFSSNIVFTIDDVLSFFMSSFYYYQIGFFPISLIEKSVKFLYQNKFLSRDGYGFKSTIFGNIVSSLYISPESALIFKEMLQSKNLCEFSVFQAICYSPDMFNLNLKKKDSWVRTEYFVNEFSIDVRESFDEDENRKLFSSIKTAKFIEDYLNVESREFLISKYSVSSGDIKRILDSFVWLLTATIEISKIVNSEYTKFLMSILAQVSLSYESKTKHMYRSGVLDE